MTQGESDINAAEGKWLNNKMWVGIVICVMAATWYVASFAYGLKMNDELINKDMAHVKSQVDKLVRWAEKQDRYAEKKDGFSFKNPASYKDIM